MVRNWTKDLDCWLSFLHWQLIPLVSLSHPLLHLTYRPGQSPNLVNGQTGIGIVSTARSCPRRWTPSFSLSNKIRLIAHPTLQHTLCPLGLQLHPKRPTSRKPFLYMTQLSGAALARPRENNNTKPIFSPINMGDTIFQSSATERWPVSFWCDWGKAADIPQACVMCRLPSVCCADRTGLLSLQSGLSYPQFGGGMWIRVAFPFLGCWLYQL